MLLAQSLWQNVHGRSLCRQVLIFRQTGKLGTGIKVCSTKNLIRASAQHGTTSDPSFTTTWVSKLTAGKRLDGYMHYPRPTMAVKCVRACLVACHPLQSFAVRLLASSVFLVRNMNYQGPGAVDPVLSLVARLTLVYCPMLFSCIATT